VANTAVTATKITNKKLESFKQTVWNYYKENARYFDWREDITPYRIVVSEIMLQQTQADRVVPKFAAFMQEFPSWQSLAKAPQAQVLIAWKGLGYNSRALRLQQIARLVCSSDSKEIPNSYDALVSLPGIGPNTAGSILAFAFNIPWPFIETNIRSVYIHHFFRDVGRSSDQKISDKELLPLVQKTLDSHNPREWYYALMDYGVFLKKTYTNPSRKSLHHIRQTRFKGSRRELRSAILHHITASPLHTCSVRDLNTFTKTYPQYSTQIFKDIIADLIKEGAIVRKSKQNSYSIPH